ncbi:amidohydrolase family protein [Phytohalomonas tamaricis]|uniref:amidohydrolase family protein n=1 Tax=Phytohalomonas tamaricis TaxID=2081032 RepID=UPI000D0AD82E|nr:amidohydrolase family protein [Phytohalomonas tamaricis]
MQVIDAHVHFWSLSLDIQPWLSHPAPNMLGDYRSMARDTGPGELLAQRGTVELLGAVHIEADAADGLKETEWLATLPTTAPQGLPFVMVAGVDLAAPDCAERLDTHISMTDRIRGVRQILNVHPDPHFDYVGRHYMREAAWQSGFNELGKRGLSFDLQLYPAQMADAARLADAHPHTLFILNHAGMYVDRHSVEGWRQWRDGLRQLAERDNVVTKLSGFGMLDHRWTPDSLRPLVLETIDAFGIERCMFASNFPVDMLYARYEQVWQAYDNIVSAGSSTEKAALFHANASRFYRME